MTTGDRRAGAHESSRPTLRAFLQPWWAVALFVVLLGLFLYSLKPPTPAQVVAQRERMRTQCRDQYGRAATRADSMRIDLSPPDTILAPEHYGGETCGDLRVRGEL